MKTNLIVLSGVLIALAACSSETDHSAHGTDTKADAHVGQHVMQVSEKEAKAKVEAAKLYMDRFNIAACEKVDLLGLVRRTSPEDGESNLRSFQVPVACAKETLAAVTKQGFKDDGKGTLVGIAPDGTPEKIKVELPEGVTAGIVEWETNRK
jgi:hypothetical protein